MARRPEGWHTVGSAWGRTRDPGSGSGIALPLLFGICGGIFVYAGASTIAAAKTGPSVMMLVGAVLVLSALWGMFGPRKPRFVLCEDGVRVKDVLLPWSSIDDYGVVENSYNGFPAHTSVTLQHVEGYTPPALAAVDAVRRPCA